MTLLAMLTKVVASVEVPSQSILSRGMPIYMTIFSFVKITVKRSTVLETSSTLSGSLICS
jgi:hypothetical protein